MTRYLFLRDVQKGATLEPALVLRPRICFEAVSSALGERSEGTGDYGGVPQLYFLPLPMTRKGTEGMVVCHWWRKSCP